MPMRRLAVLALLFVTAGCASTVVSLPDNVRIQAPSPNVPPNAAAFSGRWDGNWDGALPHVLVVEEVTADSAAVVYAWGYSSQWNLQPGSTRAKGSIERSVLTVKLQRPATVTYRMQPNGTLDALYEWSGGSARTTMRRIAQ